MKLSRRTGAISLLIICTLSVICLAPSFGSAQVQSDSVRSVTVAPGIVHTSYTKSGPYTLDVLEVDLSNPSYAIESYRPVGLVRTSQQARENDREGHRVLGAINADFFSFTTGWPVGNQVVDGEFALGLSTPRSHLAFSAAGRPLMERLSFRGWLRTPTGKQYTIGGVNDVHKNNAIILHTSFSDTATPWRGPGATFLLRNVAYDWLAGDTLRLLVASSTVEESRTLGTRDAVLWIGGGASVGGAREDVRVGDTLTTYLGFEPDIGRIANVVGGAGMILRDGQPVSDSSNVEEKASVAFLKARHPRTFVAINRDTTKLFLCTVDGRQESSIGMSFQEMADFLVSIGGWHAVNLDGGGSTTMVVGGAIVNSPSDRTGERPVANTLQIIKRETRTQTR